MNGKLILVTGVSGVGKTTVLKRMEHRFVPIVRIGFGELIHEVQRERGVIGDYTTLRERPTETVSIDDVAAAQKLLIGRLPGLRRTTHVVLDSHAVVHDTFGFRIVPELVDAAAVALDSVIVLHAPFATVAHRIAEKASGRLDITEGRFETYQALQDAAAMQFSFQARCPMFVVDTNDDLDRTVDLLVSILGGLDASLQIRGEPRKEA